MSNEVLDINTNNIIAVNVVIAIMMLGVSLELKLADFKRILSAPKTFFVGIGLQLIGLPLMTCLITWVFKIDPKLSMGMMLIASCPGGSVSNILTWMAKGNIAVSVSMTAVTSLASSITLPLNFALYTWLNPYTRPLLTEISVSAFEVVGFVVAILIVPLILGMWLGNQHPKWSQKINKPLKLFAITFLIILIALAFKRNSSQFLQFFDLFFFLVLFHNAAALALGFIGATLFKLSREDRRAVTLEVGIQNGALGIVVILTFFGHAVEMLLITGFWGLWHLVSGMLVANLWGRKTLKTSDVKREV